MKKIKINSADFAEKTGSYSHGYTIDLGNVLLIFTTGQIAIDKNGNVVAPGNPAKQSEFIFESLQQILKKSGASLDDVVKATIFVTDMNDFKEISKVRNKYFKNSEPVSTLVEVTRLVKYDCKVEIEIIAVKNKTKV